MSGDQDLTPYNYGRLVERVEALRDGQEKTHEAIAELGRRFGSVENYIERQKGARLAAATAGGVVSSLITWFVMAKAKILGGGA